MALDYQVYQSNVNMVEVTDDYNVIKQLDENLKQIKDHQHWYTSAGGSNLLKGLF
jgi:hypothetical protein